MAYVDYSVQNPVYRRLDPRQVYDDRAYIRQSQSAGLERLLYKLLGPEIIASYAFAIDPFSRFRATPKVTTSQLRTRVRPRRPSIPRSIPYRKLVRSRSSYHIPGTGSPGEYTDLEGDWTIGSQGTVNLPSQTFISEYSIDSTDSTRTEGAIGGPFEKFEYTINCPPFNDQDQYYYAFNGWDPGPQSDTAVKYSQVYQGAAGYLPESSQNLILSTQKSIAEAAIQDNVFSLMSRCLPQSKLFGLARSIGELKDFRHLLSYQTYVEGIRRRTAQLKDSPDLFLSLEFGLAPLLSDIESVVHLPARVAKKLNRLLDRSGKPTSWRTKRILSDTFPIAPAFIYPTDSWFYGHETTSNVAHFESELRMAINSTFEFPPVELPQLRRQLTSKLYGADVDIKTLYDLVPWSWLVDWFSGFGNYLDVITQINSDPSLINYGYITYASKGTVSSIHKVKRDTTKDIHWHNPDSRSIVNKTVARQMPGSMSWSFQLRKDLGDLGVSTVSGNRNLSDFQSLIISALVAQRST